MMDPLVAKLDTPEDCDQFAINVTKTHPDLALQAKRRGIELRAVRAGAKTGAERAALEAVYAYEAVRSEGQDKKFRATRTWQMIQRRGILAAFEQLVARKDDTSGYQALAAMGMQDLSFEAVVLRHPNEFSAAAVARCKERLTQYEA